MKNNFGIDEHIKRENLYLSLNTLESKLRDKENYAVLSISTTGLDNNNFNGHQPIRVTLQRYDFDEKAGAYVKGDCYDQLVMCSPEALKAAQDNKDYPIFENGGIDEQAYIRGENVISQNQLKIDFEKYLKGMDVGFIIANGGPFINEYLKKLNIYIQTSNNDGTYFLSKYLSGDKNIPILNQVSLTKEYLLKSNIGVKTNSLATLIEKLIDKNNDQELKDAFEALEKNYKGTFLRIFEINTFVSNYVKEIGLDKEFQKSLEPTQEEKEQEAKGKEARSKLQERQKAKEAAKQEEVEEPEKVNPRKNMTFEDTLEAPVLKMTIDEMVELGEISPDKVTDRQSDSEFSKLLGVMKNTNGNVGFTVLRVVSTSEENGMKPLEVAFIVYKINKGDLIAEKEKSKVFRIAVDSDIIEKELEDYDIFEENGISQEDYEKGINVLSKDNAFDKITDFFEKCPINQYPLISESVNEKGVSVAQQSLMTLGNLAEFNAPCIDIKQVLREYNYLTIYDDKYNRNIIINKPDTYSEDDITVKGVISNNTKFTDKTLIGTRTEATFIAFMINNLAKQQKELFPEEFREPSRETDTRKDRGHTGRRIPREPIAPKPEIPTPEPPVSKPEPPSQPAPVLQENDTHNNIPESSIEPDDIEAKEAPSEERKSGHINNADIQMIRNQIMNKTEVIEPSMEDDDDTLGFLEDEPSEDIPFEEDSVPYFSDGPDEDKQPKAEEITVQKSESDLTITGSDAIEALTLLTRAVIEQNKVIAVQQENYQKTISTILSHQMELIETIAEKANSKQDIEYSADNSTALQHLQKIKDDIAIIAESVDNYQISDVLEQANANIEKGQSILSKMIEKKPDKSK